MWSDEPLPKRRQKCFLESADTHTLSRISIPGKQQKNLINKTEFVVAWDNLMKLNGILKWGQHKENITRNCIYFDLSLQICVLKKIYTQLQMNNFAVPAWPDLFWIIKQHFQLSSNLKINILR